MKRNVPADQESLAIDSKPELSLYHVSPVLNPQVNECLWFICNCLNRSLCLCLKQIFYVNYLSVLDFSMLIKMLARLLFVCVVAGLLPHSETSDE